jgi:hypothetical protein
MRSEWGLSVRAALAVTIVCLSGLAAAPAKSIEAAELAGWWLAIDKIFQPLWEKGEIAVLEEFLIVSADGAVEDRLMRVDRNAGRALYCQLTHSTICSDAPLLAAARLVVGGGRLRVLSRTETAIPLDSPTGDLIIRGLAITATPEWTFAFEEDGGRLVLTSAKTGSARILVKVEPDRLRRLHAGFVVADAFGRPRKDFRPSAFTNWRCYLARATAGDRAFEPLDGAGYSQPSFLEDYLRVASYIHALYHLEHRPTADETDPERRKLIHLETEELMV